MIQLDAKNNDLSAFLNIIRYLAAFAVCVGHAANVFGLHNRFMPLNSPYIQNLGVIIFFIMSGFLIAHILGSQSKNPGYSYLNYLVDRFSRIYSAYLPALFVIAFIDYLYRTEGGVEAPYLGAKIFIGNVFMLQNYLGPFKNVFAVPAYGTAGQLWTLSIEFFIYIFIGSLFFIVIGRVGKLVLLCFLSTLFIVLPYFSATTYGLSLIHI